MVLLQTRKWRQHIVYHICWPFVVIYPYIFLVLMCARLTASLVIDLRSFCFIPASPPASPLRPRVKCHNEGKKIQPPPSFFGRFCVPK